MSADEVFIRLYYQGTVQLNMQPDQFWLTRLGLFLDLLACHQQYNGLAKPKTAVYLDDIMPMGLN
jgi:hypothetical protein